MKLFYSPGACSIGIHVLLEEIGKPYETQLVKLREGAQFAAEYTSVNPKSKVPALQRDDGSILTEYPAIAYWLARTNPEARLWPDDVESQVRALEMMDYLIATTHMHGFSRLFRPVGFAPSEGDAETVRARGLEIFGNGLALLDRTLAGNEYVTGAFSIADTVAFYIEFWATARNVPLPANCAAHYARMLARPSVQRVMQQEGLA